MFNNIFFNETRLHFSTCQLSEAQEKAKIKTSHHFPIQTLEITLPKQKLEIFRRCQINGIKILIQNYMHRLWANFGTLRSTFKILWPQKNVKNWPEKQEKWGKIIFMDFTARFKSWNTQTKFHNSFKSYRKVA